MPVIQSQLDPYSEQFARNRAAMLSRHRTGRNSSNRIC
jgi:hypothetical protein